MAYGNKTKKFGELYTKKRLIQSDRTNWANRAKAYCRLTTDFRTISRLWRAPAVYSACFWKLEKKFKYARASVQVQRRSRTGHGILFAPERAAEMSSTYSSADAPSLTNTVPGSSASNRSMSEILVLITGSPFARASTTGIQYPSWSDVKTKTEAYA